MLYCVFTVLSITKIHLPLSIYKGLPIPFHNPQRLLNRLGYSIAPFPLFRALDGSSNCSRNHSSATLRTL
ncbi:hypothetical protein OUZ56_018509 [Daphnia magna]|uniref:Uncharacterized protein n=1 Tax=Daphnia magna TaxID=35525 RepID=A0ABQ9Z917_9CRUS|nr:hypothetical protein OUZ56_018509 [Daphnia magna]